MKNKEIVQRVLALAGIEINGDKPFEVVFDEPYEHDVQKRIPSVEKAKQLLGFEANIEIKTNSGNFIADYLLVASGSNTKVWHVISELGHTIIEPVPSLFTFNIEDNRLMDIPGISVPKASVKVLNSKLEEEILSTAPVAKYNENFSYDIGLEIKSLIGTENVCFMVFGKSILERIS